MDRLALETFIAAVKKLWGPLTSATVADCRRQIETLTRAPETAVWLAELLGPVGHAELYRDPEAGFVLMSYIERQGIYRVPHDHGSGWVIYAVVSGEMEMGTYLRTVTQQGRLELVQRDAVRMRAGDCSVYLPGDIHDTLCLSDTAVVLRFTSCDLAQEDLEGRMIRYLDYTK